MPKHGMFTGILHIEARDFYPALGEGGKPTKRTPKYLDTMFCIKLECDWIALL